MHTHAYMHVMHMHPHVIHNKIGHHNLFVRNFSLCKKLSGIYTCDAHPCIHACTCDTQYTCKEFLLIVRNFQDIHMHACIYNEIATIIIFVSNFSLCKELSGTYYIYIYNYVHAHAHPHACMHVCVIGTHICKGFILM